MNTYELETLVMIQPEILKRLIIYISSLSVCLYYGIKPNKYVIIDPTLEYGSVYGFPMIRGRIVKTCPVTLLPSRVVFVGFNEVSVPEIGYVGSHA